MVPVIFLWCDQLRCLLIIELLTCDSLHLRFDIGYVKAFSSIVIFAIVSSSFWSGHAL
jgi:hypothetical protein